MNIYISMPISGYDMNERIAYAKKQKALLQEKYPDSKVVTPFFGKKKEEFEGMTYGQLMGYDITTILNNITHMYFCEGWEKSKGCRLERAAAEIYELGIL